MCSHFGYVQVVETADPNDVAHDVPYIPQAKCTKDAIVSSISALDFFKHQAAVFKHYDYNLSTGRRTFHDTKQPLRSQSVQFKDTSTEPDTGARGGGAAADGAATTPGAGQQGSGDGDPPATTPSARRSARRRSSFQATRDTTSDASHGQGDSLQVGGSPSKRTPYGWTNVFALNGEAMRDMEASFQTLQSVFQASGAAIQNNQCEHLKASILDFGENEQRSEQRREHESMVSSAKAACDKVQRQLKECDKTIKEIQEHREAQEKRDDSGYVDKTIRLFRSDLVAVFP